MDSPMIFKKDAEEAARFRRLANAAFGERNMPEALRMYTRSISMAPCVRSTVSLALAFANRSAVQFELGDLEACLSDIQQAIVHEYPKRLSYRLLRRKAKCHMAMGDVNMAKASYSAAVYCCPLEDEKLRILQEMATAKLPEQCYKRKRRVRPPTKLYLGQNPLFPCSASVRIQPSFPQDDRLFATEDIPTGKVLLVEKACASALHQDKYGEYCDHCMRSFPALIPCKTCTTAMYCSVDCRRASWEQYHQMECPLLICLPDTEVFRNPKVLLTLRMFATSLTEELASIESGYRSMMSSQATAEPDSDAESNDFCRHYISSEKPIDINLSIRCSSDVCDALHSFEKLIPVLMEAIDKDTQARVFGTNQTEKKLAEMLLTKCRLIVESHYIDVEEYGPTDAPNGSHKIKHIGDGIYPLFTFIGHRCIPNAMKYYRGNVLVLISTLPIAKGEEVFISYQMDTRACYTTDLEQAEIFYDFSCDCFGCADPLPPGEILPICPTCKGIVHDVNGKASDKCLHCVKTIDAAFPLRMAYLMLQRLSTLAVGPWDVGNVTEMSNMINVLHNTVAMSPCLQITMQQVLLASIAQAGPYYLDTCHE